MGYNTSSLKLVTSMPLNNLKIVNFRNILNTELTLDHEINVVLGSNGQGKTSLLESIYFLINGKSDKTNDLNEIKNINHPNLYVEGTFNNINQINKCSIFSENGKKKVQINDKKVKRAEELKKLGNVVLFNKNFIDSIEGSNKPRRESFDRIISSYNTKFKNELKELKEFLSRKGHILRTSKDDKLVNFIDEKIIELSLLVSKKRANWLKNHVKIINKLSPTTSDEYKYSLKYETHCNSKEIIISNLNLAKNKERLSCKPLIGAHKDTFTFINNGKDILKLGSEGEKKTLGIMIKMAEIVISSKILNKDTIFLIDEIMSFLDKKRLKFFLQLLKRSKVQSMITSNEKLILQNFANCSIFGIKNGVCKKIS